MGSHSVPESVLIHTGMEIIHANQAFCTLIGRDSPTQVRGLSLKAVVTSEHHSALCEQVARIENRDAPVLGHAVELQTATDTTQRAILVSSLIEWDGTEQVQTTVLPVDEANSPAGRQLREQAMDDAPIGITIADSSQSDNPLIYVNDGFTELTGYPRDEILGQNCRFLQGDATHEKPVTQLRAAIDAEEPVTVVLRNYRKDGSMFWNRVTVVPIRANSGAVTHYLGYQQDVTAEKRFEQDLTLFKEQAEAATKAIFITDPDGTIQYVNPAFERMTGYSAADAIGRNARILKSGHQGDDFYEELWERITAGEVWEAELTNQTKHGELVEISQKIIPVTDTRGTITQFVAIEQDLTEETLTTQTLDVLNRVLRHNLRNAMNVIDGYAELLEDGSLEAAPREAAIRAIREQTRSMQTIAEKTATIRNLWNRRDHQQSWERFDIETAVEAYRAQYPGAEITAILDADVGVHVRNAELFEKALSETVQNAVIHCEQPSPAVTITVQRDADEDQVQISVADTGPGVPESERHALESGEETPLNHSLGIGLWLIEWITTSLGGNVTIVDREPRGSVVTFHLPNADRCPLE